MNLLYLVIAGISVILFFLIRARWLLWQVNTYRINALWYCWKTKQSKEVVESMSEIWPVTHILIEPWRWDFRRYVVDQVHYDDMTLFVIEEMQKKELAMEMKNGQDDSHDGQGKN